MTRVVAPETCPDCGGNVDLLGKPGRLRRAIGGGSMEIPASLPIPTCDACGTEWMDDATALLLSQLDRPS